MALTAVFLLFLSLLKIFGVSKNEREQEQLIFCVDYLKRTLL